MQIIEYLASLRKQQNPTVYDNSSSAHFTLTFSEDTFQPIE